MPPKNACPVCGGAAVAIGTSLACSRCLHFWDSTDLLTVQEHEAKPRPAPPEPEKVISGSVIGYRAWRIKDWQLTGTGVNRHWVPGVNEATCDTGPAEQSAFGSFMVSSFGSMFGQHPAPAVGCHCGITALARFAKTDSHWTGADVFGAIEAWSDETIPAVELGDVAAAAGVEVKGEIPELEHGRFILHGNGFRAQYGKIVLLTVEDEWPTAKKAAVRALAREHDADVCRQAHLEDAAKEHGQLVPDELLEWAKESEYEEVVGSTTVWSLANPVVTFPSASLTISINRARSAYGLPGLSSPVKPKKKGIKQTLGYPGPPANPIVKASKGDRVKDSKGQVWQCTKSGRPGLWEAEDSSAE